MAVQGGFVSTRTLPASPAAGGYTAISRRALDLEDYIDVARRHAAWIIGPVLAGIVIAAVVAFLLPNVYVSQAEMQITPAQISESIVPSTLNQQLNERIMAMENEILSRTSLSNIIQDPRLDLYKSDRASKPIEDVIEQMRTRDIKIRIDALPGDRRASAFSISFSYPDRMKAQQTVQVLITKFTDSNLTTQRTQQNMLSTFVRDELTEDKAKLDLFNEQLTRFRVQNSGKLPEESNLNIARLTALQQKASGINDSLNRLAQERIELDTSLKAQEERVQLFNMFEKETAAAQSAAAATPAVRQQNEQLQQINKSIEGLEASLVQLHQVYSSKYPDIRDAEARLQVLKNQRDALLRKQEQDEAARQAEIAKQPATPVKKPAISYASAQNLLNLEAGIEQTKTVIRGKDVEAENLKKDLAATNKEIDAYQTRLEATSGLEATYAELIANQRSAADKYQQSQQKQQLAQQSSELLQRNAGERLEVLDPPSLPVQPAKPNRWLIVGAGTAVSFILGLALAGVQEAKDTSLKNLKDVRAYTNLPVLSSIPLLENTMLVRRKRRLAYLAWSAAVIVGMLAVSAALYYHSTSTV
jgi:uncharacterized protein involved in exopolysaccharide biosynthesis